MTKPVIQVLLIEDSPTDVLMLQESMANDTLSSFEFVTVDRLAAGLEELRTRQFDLTLLDLGLPDSQGLKTFKKVYREFPAMPVVVLSGLTDEQIALEAVQSGAQDYLVKGPTGWQIAARAIRHAIERKRMEERLNFMATHDSLTGLPNRTLFQDRLAHAIERARRRRGDRQEKSELAVMLLDLDNFKSANDTFGHVHGDILLQTVTDQLKNCIRESDTLARMGGDEFTLIFESLSGADDVGLLAAKILTLFDRPFQIAGQELRITASIGISQYPRDGEDAETLLRHADIAMYDAKRQKNTYRYYKDTQMPLE